MRKLSDNITTLGFTLALLLFALFGVTTYQSIQRLRADKRWVGHTNQVLLKVDELRLSIVNAENGRRAHALTGNKAYLKVYQASRNQTITSLKGITALTSDNPNQQQRLNQIEPLVFRRMELLQRLVDLAEKGQLDRSTQMELMQQGNDLRQKVQVMLDELKGEEEELLQQRMQATDHSIRRIFWISGFGYGLSFLLLWLVFRLLRQEIKTRKQAEVELQQQAEAVYDLYNNAPCGYHSLNENGVIVQINNTELQWLGYSREEIVGQRSFTDLVTPEGKQLFQHSFPHFKEQGWINNVEFDLVTKDGKILPVSLNATAVRDAEGNFVISRSTLFDIRDRRELDANRRQAEAELQRLNSDLHRSNQELEQFAYVASHDLQEPLRAVTGYTQLLRTEYGDRLDTNAQEYMHYIVDGADRMRQLIQDLLAYSRVGTRGQSFVTVDCNLIFNQICNNLQVAISETSAQITCDPLPTVFADKTQMLQLFQNLISNAIKFHRDVTPEIHVGVSQRFAADNSSTPGVASPAIDMPPSHIILFVKDNGIGIKPQYLDRIFEIFRRLHSRRSFEGTGIGLAICKKIVERHGGQIWAESTPGAGTTFFFTLPSPLQP